MFIISALLTHCITIIRLACFAFHIWPISGLTNIWQGDCLFLKTVGNLFFPLSNQNWGLEQFPQPHSRIRGLLNINFSLSDGSPAQCPLSGPQLDMSLFTNVHIQYWTGCCGCSFDCEESLVLSQAVMLQQTTSKLMAVGPSGAGTIHRHVLVLYLRISTS